jgi:patatin-like phospholipase/acyl hydrolase
MITPAPSPIAAIAPYRILAIDGGGLRGIIPLMIIRQLDAQSPGWRDHIHMYAGTSTGGLIALCLAAGLAPDRLLQLYVDDAAAIFGRSLWREALQLFFPKYSNRNLEHLCRQTLGGLRLQDLREQHGRHVVITALQLDDHDALDPAARRWKAKVFHNLPTVDDSADDGELAWRLAMRTSAAPTYFGSFDGYVDGGVFANNPSMCALAQTQDDRLALRIPFDSIKMVSLSTGFRPYYYRGEERWGLLRWAPHLVDVLTDGVNEVAEFQTRQMMAAGNFLRVAAPLPVDIALDDASKVQELQRLGEKVDLSEALSFVAGW